MEQLLFYRQPISDRNQQVIGYEIIAETDEGETKNSQKKSINISNLLKSLDASDLNFLLSNRRMFLDAPLLCAAGSLWDLPVEKSVLQIWAPKSSCQSELVAYLEMIQKKDFKIALDGASYSGAQDEILEKVDFIKFDISSKARSDIEYDLDKLRRYQGKFLAQKVETQKDFRVCQELGFDYFQGFFYCEPTKNSGPSFSAGKITIMKLLAQIQNPKTELKDLEKIISLDTALCYRLLQYINSACFGLVKKIDSISRAVNCLGLSPLKIWTSVILLARIERKPLELLKTSLIRGRMCQNFAEKEEEEDTSPFFLAGLFSLLPALMDKPMEDLLAELPLSDELCEGLTSGKGRMGRILNFVIDYERGNWEKLLPLNGRKKCLRSIYLDAVRFTENSVQSVC